jgi:peptide/nickel transport system substrate-binding protein
MESPESKANISRRLFLAGTGAAVAGVAVAACGDDDKKSTSTTAAPGSTTPGTGTAAATTAAEGGPKKGGTLKIGIVGSTNDILDGQYIVAKADQLRMLLSFEPLVHYDADWNISYEHGLAEKVEAVTSDHYIVTLKDGPTWSDGKPVTADDVLYSFERRLDPESEAPLKAMIALLDISGVTVVDDKTIDFKLKQGAVTFLNVLAEYTMTVVPRGYKRFAGDASTQIGSGPFILDSFTPGSESVHKRNPAYWMDPELPYLDEVQVIDFADQPALLNALKGGEVDAIVDVPFGEVEALSQEDGISILESEAGSWLTITMAVDQAPMDNPKVRQAIRLICDREEMVNRVLAGHGSVANDLYGRFDPCFAKDIPQRVQDIEKAKQLLEEAGQAGMTIDLFAPDDTAGLPELAQVFAEQAQAAGITVNAQVLDGGTYWGDQYGKRTFATDFWGTRPYLVQVAAGSLHDATYPDTHWPVEGSTFADDYLEALQTVDDTARCEIIHKMMQEEWDNGGWCIPFFNNLIDATASDVMGFVAEPNVLNLDHYGRGMKKIWLDR